MLFLKYVFLQIQTYKIHLLTTLLTLVVLQKHFESIVNEDDESLMEAVEDSQRATTRGRQRVEKQIEESLLLSQFVINNTIAVQE